MNDGDKYFWPDKGATLTLTSKTYGSGKAYYFTSDKIIDSWIGNGFNKRDGTQYFLGAESVLKDTIGEWGLEKVNQDGGRRRKRRSTKRVRRNRRRYSRRK